MNALVLAYTNLHDLPRNWNQFDSIDLFGSTEEVWQYMKKGGTSLTNHRKLLLNIADLPSRINYSQVYIKHPDPFGEPRNWMFAISVIRENFQGYIDCIFWSKQEILAFNFLLVNLWSPKHVKFVSLKTIKESGEKKLYVRWRAKKMPRTTYKRMSMNSLHPNIFLFHYFKTVALYLTSKISIKTCKEVLARSPTY